MRDSKDQRRTWSRAGASPQSPGVLGWKVSALAHPTASPATVPGVAAPAQPLTCRYWYARSLAFDS